MKSRTETTTIERARRIACAAALLFLAGCADLSSLTPSARLTPPEELDAGATFAGENVDAAFWPAEDWWTAFDDPQLDRLEEQALAGNPSLAAAQARVENAVALAGLARAARRPRVDGTLESTRERYSENDVVPRPPAGSFETPSRLRLDFGYELDFWHKNRAAFEAALSRAEAARADAFAARLMLSVAVADTYVELARLHDRRDVARATLEQQQQILDLTRQRVEAGLDTRVELEQAEGALPATRVTIEALDEALAHTRHALAALLGRGPDAGLAIERPALRNGGDAVALPSALPADLLGRRPDVAASRRRVEAAAHDVAVARAAFYPDIDLLAFAGFSSLGLSELVDAGSRVVGAGPALRLPLFDRGALKSGLKARNADYDAAVELYDATLVDALRDTADQLASVRSVAAQTREQRRALEAATAAYDLAAMRYREGLGNYLTVLAVETEVLEQRQLEADLRARAYRNRIGLIRALGGGFAEDAPLAGGRTASVNEE